MSVNPKKPRKVLVVHGVQLGADNDQNQGDQIDALIRARLGRIPLKYKTETYRYENVNDDAQKKLRNLLKVIAKTALASAVTDKVIDMVGDVVISLRDGDTAEVIRQGLKEQILDIYATGSPCYVVAHSLGSIYAFDVINELMRDDRYFNRQSRKTWPVQGLITLGSPIGLSMFKVSGRKRVESLGEGTKWFRWVNYWDRTDPVVSGNIFGKRLSGYEIAEKYQTDSSTQGWAIRDVPVDTGKAWLLAHVGYWDNPMVGDGLVNMITN